MISNPDRHEQACCRRRRLVQQLAVVFLLSSSLVSLASAAPYFEGKTIRIINATAPGGMYDTYSRVFARYVRKYLPGNPRLIVENMPGAAGIIATSYLAKRASRDGLTVGAMYNSVAMNQRIGLTGVHYDARKFIPLGSVESLSQVILLRPDLPVSFADLRKKQGKRLPMGTPGPGVLAYAYLKALEIEGWRIRVVPGYIGQSDTVMAMQGKEIDGTSRSLTAARSLVKAGIVKILARYGAEPVDLPRVQDFVPKETAEVLDYFAKVQYGGRPYVLPPGVSSDIIQMWRKAFDEVMKDPAFLAEVEKVGGEPHLVTGEELKELWKQQLAAPDSLVKKIKQSMGIE
jgi:tripartite-type tricarboxylate transporter receptor subunit TctC